MYKLTFTLKQHTPIIHFQHDQEGATLRASEVKPKLDKFIIEKYGGLIKMKDNYPTWFVGKGDQPALDYKMNIVAKNQDISYLKDSIHKEGIQNPLFFGNMGDSPPKHYSDSNGIIVTIHSFNSELLKTFNENNLCEFFLNNNFGTRQTKGLGCFYPSIHNKNIVKTHPLSLLPVDSCWLEINSIEDEKIFSTIDYFWKWLKSGINYNQNLYKDSLLKLFISDNTTYKWEKRKVKEQFLGLTPDSDTKYFVRAFMGLADNFTYKWIPKKKQKAGEVYSPIDMTINISCADKNIQRNSAPFIFVPYKNEKSTQIFILYQPKYGSILNNKIFNLSVTKIDPVKLIIGVDTKTSKDKFKKIYPDLKDSQSIIKEAENYLPLITNYKLNSKASELIEKAKDFISFLKSPQYQNIILSKEIITPPDNPDLKKLLPFTHKKMGNSFDVKDFSSNFIINAKILTNGK